MRIYPDEAILRDYVEQSNLIEGITAEPGDPLFDNHYEAARLVVVRARDGSGRPRFSPRQLHRMIMASEPDATPGRYRDVNVSVGGELKMHHARVYDAMVDLLADVRRVMRRLPGTRPPESYLWEYHHEFQRIHPFRDGNGRTGRLWLNSLRLACGDEWIVIRADDREAYYEAIRAYEKGSCRNGNIIREWEWRGEAREPT